MSVRCPGATIAGKTVLNNHRLVFRGTNNHAHATIEVADGYKVPIIIWKISAKNEAALDMYEGVPRYYEKMYFLIRIGENLERALVYIMAPGKKLGAPSIDYYNVIRQAYEKAGFDKELLEAALDESVAGSKAKRRKRI
jgi:hypothetical protein